MEQATEALRRSALAERAHSDWAANHGLLKDSTAVYTSLNGSAGKAADTAPPVIDLRDSSSGSTPSNSSSGSVGSASDKESKPIAAAPPWRRGSENDWPPPATVAAQEGGSDVVEAMRAWLAAGDGAVQLYAGESEDEDGNNEGELMGFAAISRTGRIKMLSLESLSVSALQQVRSLFQRCIGRICSDSAENIGTAAHALLPCIL